VLNFDDYNIRSLDYPDVEFHFVSGGPGSDGGKQVRKTKLLLKLTLILKLRKIHSVSDSLWSTYTPLAFRDLWQVNCQVSSFQ